MLPKINLRKGQSKTDKIIEVIKYNREGKFKDPITNRYTIFSANELYSLIKSNPAYKMRRQDFLFYYRIVFGFQKPKDITKYIPKKYRKYNVHFKDVRGKQIRIKVQSIPIRADYTTAKLSVLNNDDIEQEFYINYTNEREFYGGIEEYLENYSKFYDDSLSKAYKHWQDSPSTFFHRDLTHLEKHRKKYKKYSKFVDKEFKE